MRNQNIRYTPANMHINNLGLVLSLRASSVCPFCNEEYYGFTIVNTERYKDMLIEADFSCIQDVFTDEAISEIMTCYESPAQVREFIMTGICPKCWHQMTAFDNMPDLNEVFGDDDYDDEEDPEEGYKILPLDECFPFR